MKMIPRSAATGPDTAVAVGDVYYGNPPTYQGTESYESEYSYSMMTGQDIVGFHKLRKSGVLLPFTAFEQYVGSGSIHGTSFFSHTNGTSGWTTEYNPIPSNHGDNPWIIPLDEVREKANELSAEYDVQRAAARVYSSGWDALTWYAELGKTAAMFQKIIPRILYYITEGRADKAWLEGRYGWRLLMYDVEDINNLLRSFNKKFTRFKESASSSSSDYETKVTEISWGSGTFNAKTHTTWELGTRGSVVADLSPPKIALNPIVTAWETLPFSFLLDWLIAVGQSLEALSFLALQQHYAAGGGVKISANRLSTITDLVPNTGYTINHTLSGSYQVEYVHRVPMSVSSIPQIRLNLNAFKVMDLVALAVGAYYRR